MRLPRGAFSLFLVFPCMGRFPDDLLLLLKSGRLALTLWSVWRSAPPLVFLPFFFEGRRLSLRPESPRTESARLPQAFLSLSISLW